MQAPQIDVLCSKPVACSDTEITLDVVLRILPPYPEVHFPRPALNLGLVLDRSGSMAGHDKMPYAIRAAVFAVEQLLPTDRVSVTLYDDQIETPVPSTLASDKGAIAKAVQAATPRGSTNLHGGWRNGMTQVREFLVPDGVNRVLLLSDGLANQGVTDPNTIAQDVAQAAKQSVTTTTIGVGTDYNEHLMLQMARSGGGNYYFVNDPVQFRDMFQTELTGLMNLMGQKVSLGLEPAPGVTVVDQLNDYERLPTGRYKLAEMVAGMPIVAVIRLSVAPRSEAGPLCGVRLAWDDPATGTRLSRTTSVVSRPPVPFDQWQNLPAETEVVQQAGLLEGARAQREFAQAVERGDLARAEEILRTTESLLQQLPTSAEIAEELRYFAGTRGAYSSDPRLAQKRSHFRGSSRQMALLYKMGLIGRGNPPPSS